MALIVGVPLKVLAVPLSLDQLLHCEEHYRFLGQTKKCFTENEMGGYKIGLNDARQIGQTNKKRKSIFYEKSIMVNERLADM